MKRRTKRALVFWSLFSVLGLLALVLGALFPLPGWLVWGTSLGLWGATLIWIGLHFALRPKMREKRSVSLAGSGVRERIARETSEAVFRYLDSVKRRGLLKHDALYERPWYLMCGPAGAGKSTLLDASGMDFPVQYPSEQDGLQVAGTSRVQWRFSNNAVWIDVPGAYLTPGGADEWRAAVDALARSRPRSPIDGMFLVVSGADIVESDPASVKEQASALRTRLDEAIAAWGIEFPVFLVFGRMDEVPGFGEFFASLHDDAKQRVLGATLSEAQRSQLPRRAFAQEFQLLCSSLSTARLDVLSSARDAARKRLVCRFAIHFEGLQEKLGDFVAELFKPSSYEGKPVFHGFYFTSCQRGEGQESAPEVNISQTVVAHPLNPRRQKASAQAGGEARATAWKTFFVGPLFTDAATKGRGSVARTQKRSRREMVRHYATAAAIALAGAAALVYLLVSYAANRRLLDDMQRLLAEQDTIRSYADAYRRFGQVGRAVELLQRHEDRGVPFSLRPLYRGRKVLDTARPEFIALSRKLIVKPGIAYLEHRINRHCSRIGELDGKAHRGLYRSLKAYLSLSEAMGAHPDDRDTSFLREALMNAVAQALLRAERQSRLPHEVETVLQDNMGLFLAFYARGAIPPVQENQHLVLHARRRLRRLPDATALFETVANRLREDVPGIVLGDLLGRGEETILHSDATVSAIYTREGWERYVRDEIARASKDPFTIDWVIGGGDPGGSQSLPEPEALREGMTRAYFEAYARAWLDFLGSFTMEPLGGLGRAGRVLEKLAGEQSEIAVFLDAVGRHTHIEDEEPDDGLAAAGAGALDAASRIKATKRAAGHAKRAGKAAAGFSFEKQYQGRHYLSRIFDPLRSFAQSTRGSMGGCEEYRGCLRELAGTLADIEERGDDHAIAAFDGSDSDPLLAAWKYAHGTIASMPPELGSACSTLLVLPVVRTGDAVSQVLSERLDDRWRNEVVRPFTSRCSGRYPFRRASRESASFTDVMDFFRPSTGTLWGFHSRVLAPFVIKEGDGWTVISVGSLVLDFAPEMVATLARAERIRDIFFKPDGTLRSLDITVTPLAKNRRTAALEVCGQEATLVPGGQSAHFRWPVESESQVAVLRASVGDNFTQDISFQGRWALMQLLNEARISALSRSTFDATWEMNVQNMYRVFLTYRIQVAGSDHPFGDPVFAGFDCPTGIMRKKAYGIQG
ncbi:MAG: type VI secretion system membrane subunit TssM [Chitinivibrionales bacterium]|nr:type VI secretion system membrane subunit TssM [Chitinivibrionales bacterium]MBD3396413.1 type VI secretion system membrane subunit TssM [Chitinivibrionales bacterium]